MKTINELRECVNRLSGSEDDARVIEAALDELEAARAVVTHYRKTAADHDRNLKRPCECRGCIVFRFYEEATGGGS